MGILAPSNTPPRSAGSSWLLCALVMVLAFAVYAPTLRYPFLNYDDELYVTKNLHVQAGLTSETVAWALTTNFAANWAKPKRAAAPSASVFGLLRA